MEVFYSGDSTAAGAPLPTLCPFALLSVNLWLSRSPVYNMLITLSGERTHALVS